MRDDSKFVNPYWHRLAEARPRLSDQIRSDRQEVRGRLWYVLSNDLTGNHFRLTPEAWYFVGLLDGSRTVDDAMAAAQAHLGDEAPRQSEVVRLMTQLHGLGALVGTEGNAETAGLYDQAERTRRRQLIQQMRSPLAIRFPLFDPDRLLTGMLPLARLMFSAAGLLVWLIVVGYGASVAFVNIDTLSANFLDRVFSTDNLALMTAVFVLMKLCHEFGHGLAVKRWGGEVHEMGMMLLVLIPVPYVNATAANEFQTRLRRIAVSSGGMYVELFLAATAILLWSRVEPGLLRASLYNAALIGSVSTLLFNLNPLMRFDGYYILSDLISMPNLGSRGTAYAKYLIQRYILWLGDAMTPETDTAEKRWLIGYAIASLIYRVFLVAAIAFAVAQKLFFVGVALALWAATQMFVLPILGAIRFLLFSPRLKGARVRVICRALIAVGTLAFLLFVVPAPRTTYANGVVWVPQDGEIVSLSDGFVDKIVPAEGAWVEPGDVLIRERNETIVAERDRLVARLGALEAQTRADFATDRVALKLSRMELDQTRRRLSRANEKIEDMTLRAATKGYFALAVPEDIESRFVRRGERLGFIIRPEATTIRVVVAQNDIGLVRDDTQAIRLLPVGPNASEQKARLVRAIPAASAQLPSMALSTVGGGRIDVVADKDGRPRAVREVFHFELAASDPRAVGEVGRKVHVKFVHSDEPLGAQALRRLRQLFLSRLNV